MRHKTFRLSASLVASQEKKRASGDSCALTNSTCLPAANNGSAVKKEKESEEMKENG